MSDLADELEELTAEFSDAALNALTATLRATAATPSMPASAGAARIAGGASNPVAAAQMMSALSGQQIGGIPGWALTEGSVGGTEIAPGEIDTTHIDGLDVSVLIAGTFRVGGLAGVPDAMVVYDQNGDEVAIFDEDGVLLKDPQNESNQVRFKDGVLEFSNNNGVTWETAIDAEGITANAIRIGTAPGGHNGIPNASFENTPFAAINEHGWPADAAWNTTVAAIAADINVSTGGASLQLGTVTY